MNAFEKQMQLGRELMELNAQWFSKIAEFDSENLKKYVGLNQEFAAKLPEVRDVQSFVELQRQYGENLWSSTQEAFQTRGELLKGAVEANGELVKKAISPAEEEVKPAAKTSRARKAA